MARMQARNDTNHVYLLEGTMPDMATIDAAWPLRPHTFRDAKPAFRSREEALAVTLTARTRRLMHYWRNHRPAFDNPDEARLVPLETWVLGPPQQSQAAFRDWFSSDTGSDYRLIVHLTPRPTPTEGRRYRCPEPYEFWSMMYAAGQQSKKLWLRPRKVPRSLRAQTRPLLDELLRIYTDQPHQVSEWLAGLGHSCWYGQFLLEPRIE